VSPILEAGELQFCRAFGEARMQGSWHDFDVWRERQRGLLREAEARRLAQAARPDWRECLEKVRGPLERFGSRIVGLGRQVVPPHGILPPDEEVALSGTKTGLVEAQVRSSSVIEFHQEDEGYVIREVDLGTGDHLLYLSTNEPEWAAWIWERKTHR
jgi:hypothetical protein